MSRQFKATCKFTGRFECGTRAEFKASIPSAAAAMMAAPLVKSYRQVIDSQWPDPKNRPNLKKLVITIDL